MTLIRRNQPQVSAMVLAILILFISCTCTPTNVGSLSSQFYGLVVVNNPEAKTVSLAELQQFLQNDMTNERQMIPYKDDSDATSGYMCANFAVDLHNNAEKAGIRCAIVTIHPSLPPIFGNYSHAFNAFNTTDKGMKYVDISTGTDNIAYMDVFSMYIDYPPDKCSPNKYSEILGNPRDFKVEW